MKKIFGKKAGMTQIFTEDGVSIPVTVIEAYPAKVVQIKTQATDGYDAVKVAYIETKEHRINKPKKGELDKACRHSGTHAVRRGCRCLQPQA